MNDVTSLHLNFDPQLEDCGIHYSTPFRCDADAITHIHTTVKRLRDNARMHDILDAYHSAVDSYSGLINRGTIDDILKNHDLADSAEKAGLELLSRELGPNIKLSPHALRKLFASLAN